MITGYAIQAHNKIYVVPAQTKRFTKAIADIFIKHIFSEILKTQKARYNNYEREHKQRTTDNHGPGRDPRTEKDL